MKTNKEEYVKRILGEKVGIIDISTMKLEDTIEELGMDELDIIEAVMEFEQDFQIEFNDDEIKSIKTVNDALTLFVEKTS